MTKKYEQIAYDEAAQSKCQERQVGAVLVRKDDGVIMGQGHNYSTTCACNDDYLGGLVCPKDVVHAEVMTLNKAHNTSGSDDDFRSYGFNMYITQPPCNNCLKEIDKFCETYNCKIHIKVCEQFLKFDNDKDRFDLIPPEWELALAKVLTHGAHKYKPNNWRKGEVDRYIGAVKRHFNAYQRGERIDAQSGMPHLWLMMTNVGFLITLNEVKEDYE